MARLGRELALLFFSPSMPEDMALTCISSPARRALLEGLPLTAQQRARLQQLLHMLQQVGVGCGRRVEWWWVGGGVGWGFCYEEGKGTMRSGAGLWSLWCGTDLSHCGRGAQGLFATASGL